MDIETAIKHALDREAILFLGAGFSIGGTNRVHKSMPSASELSEILCKDMGISISNQLSTIAGRYVGDKLKGKGLDSLINLLSDILSCVETESTQDEILSIDWKRIYTTNFDDVVEVSSEKLQKERISVTATIPKYKSNSFSDIFGSIIHINGFIRNINKKTFDEEFKISDESYLKSGFFDTKWRTQFESDLRNSNAIIFVGYSLQYDIDLQEILYSLKVTEKCIFIDRADLDENTEYKMSTFGTVDKNGKEGLSSKINIVKSNYVPKINFEKLKSSNRITLATYEERNLGSKEVLNLLDKGDYERELFRSIKPYYVHRKNIYESIEKVIDNYKICILCSNFGNGKTITLEYLASEFVESCNVFYLNDTQYMQEDLRIICKDDKQRNLVLVDDYGMFLPLFKELIGEFPENLRIIATSRTAINDNLMYELTEKIGYRNDDIYAINIDKLDRDDRKELVHLLNDYHCWGKYSEMSNYQKNNIIENKYKNKMSNIFYMLLDSGIIEDKIKKIVDCCLINETIKKFVIAQTINMICKFKLNFHQIVSLASINTLILKNSCRDSSMKEIYDIENEEVHFKSAILSQYIVKIGEYNDLIRDTLIEIYKNAEEQEYKGIYYNLKKLIISRSNIIEVFTNKNDNVNSVERRISEFYDAIMNKSHVEKNPFFWLQYAITVLNLKDYARAKLYFDNAYAYAKSLDDFDYFQLDTHKARFLLEYKIEIDKVKETAFEDFLEAHQKLMNNSNNSTKLSYVLRQIQFYNAYYKEFYTSFNPSEQLEFINCLRDVKIKFEEYFRSINSSSNVDYFVKISYKEYRKIFKDKDIINELYELDKIYNSKLPLRDKNRV